MEKYSFYDAVKMVYEGKKMKKENTGIYMCFSESYEQFLEFRFISNNELCGGQRVDKSDFNRLWIEITEKTPQQIETEEIEKKQRELAEEQKKLADRIAQINNIK